MAIRKRRTSRGLRRNVIVGTRDRGSRTLTKLKTTTKRKTSRTATKKKPVDKKAPAKERRTSRKVPAKKPAKKRTSRKAPAKKPAKKRTSRKAPAKKRIAKKAPAKKRRTSRVTKKKAVKKRKTSRSRKSTGYIVEPLGKKSKAGTYNEQTAVADTHVLLASWGVPGYSVRFKSMRSKAGYVDFRKKTIVYSKEAWAHLPQNSNRITVVHEVAHAVVMAEHGPHVRRGKVRPHGKEWKAQMREMGIPNPETTMSRSDSKIMRDLPGGRKMPRVKASCCGKTYSFTLRSYHTWVTKGRRCMCSYGEGEYIKLVTAEGKRMYQEYLKTKRLAANTGRLPICGCC